MADKINKDCGIVILNYNTYSDAIDAARSVINDIKNFSYVVCLADNCSTKEGEYDNLKNSNLPNCEYIRIDKNEGYAKGNNEGIRFLLSKYELKYIAIMNPDVLIINPGTIDALLNRLEALPDEYCGIQPLVCTTRLGDPHYQTTMLRVEDYLDVLIDHFHLFKKMFKKKYSRLIYMSERPYYKEIDFEVPSGAFFVIRVEDFESVCFFDERTFLYGEERILGYKLKEKGKRFLLMPSLIVRHEGGKSTGSSSKHVKWYSVKIGMRSTDIYLKYYLKCGLLARSVVALFAAINWITKKVSYYLNNDGLHLCDDNRRRKGI